MQNPLRKLHPDDKTLMTHIPSGALMTDKHMITGDYLQAIKLDTHTIPQGNLSQEHERQLAIHALHEKNSFKLAGGVGPYNLLISLRGNRLIHEVHGMHSPESIVHPFPLGLVRPIFKQYREVCESYYDAIKVRTEREIEAIDMGRRGLHNDGATLIQEHFAPLIEMDFETARAFFSLMYCLHWKG
jgi:uncharacterized protein (UPF0262 family)